VTHTTKTAKQGAVFLQLQYDGGVKTPGGALLVAFAAGIALAGLGDTARAEVSGRLGRLAGLRAEVEHAEGPLAYVALRRVWSEWDQGDPAEVEEVLLGVSEDRHVSAPARAYAGLLEAYARRRRGDLDGARARVDGLGFVGRWLVVGPFDNEGKAGLPRAFGPEEDLAVPPTLGRTYDGKEHPVRWRPAQSGGYGWTDFGVLFRPTAKVCAYATTFVHDARPGATARPVSIWAGSAGAMRVWWNGIEVLRDDKYRDLDAERFAARVVMKPG
jgi:hypothetical protein